MSCPGSGARAFDYLSDEKGRLLLSRRPVPRHLASRPITCVLNKRHPGIHSEWFHRVRNSRRCFGNPEGWECKRNEEGGKGEEEDIQPLNLKIVGTSDSEEDEWNNEECEVRKRIKELVYANEWTADASGNFRHHRAVASVSCNPQREREEHQDQQQEIWRKPEGEREEEEAGDHVGDDADLPESQSLDQINPIATAYNPRKGSRDTSEQEVSIRRPVVVVPPHRAIARDDTKSSGD